MHRWFALVLALATVRVASAQPEPDGAISEDNDLGATITIEAITIRGNTATQESIIRRALPIAEGEALKQGDSRLRDARFKLLATGFFRDVQLAMRRGSVRGQVILDVTVIERGTFVLNRLWFGHSDFSSYWAGADVGDRNVLGLGISIGGGVIYAAPGDDSPDRSQWAGEIRLGVDSLRGSHWGLGASLTLVHGSDRHEEAFGYRRFGSRFGATYDAAPWLRLSAGGRVETISHEVDVPWLVPGSSLVVAGNVGIDVDTRTDPILPHAGSRETIVAELGSSAVGDYDFAVVYAHVEKWFPLLGRHQTIGVRFDGAFASSGAPRFDRVYVVDVDRMLTPRAMGLLLSDAEPFHILTDRDAPAIGTAGMLATLEYARDLWRGTGKRRVYGGDLFIGAGVWALADDNTTVADLYIDAGLRIDTEVGIFELTFANALGRLR